MLVNTILADTLSALIGLSSVAFYIAAFFYPEVHRRSDIAWSGLGAFYALILWLCAGQMTLAVLAGQIAVVALVCGLGWQTLTIRRQKTPVYQQTPVVITPEVVGNWAKNKVNELRIAPAEPVPLKLEKRSFSEFSEERLGQRIDPRRRPAYEYEFVEDGILEASELEALAEPQLSLDLTAEETLDVGVEDSAPPSAIAQIISVESESIEVKEPQPDQAIDETVQADAIEVGSSQPKSLAEEKAKDEDARESEEFTAELEASKTEPDELEANKPEASEPEASEPEASEPTEVDRDDWDDELFEEVSTVSEASTQAAKPSQPKPVELKKKPGLLATPLILIGWIKDITASFTKPKPSKPVIEIPRREPSPAAASPRIESTPAAESPRAEEAIGQIDSHDEANDENDSWEESNWDD